MRLISTSTPSSGAEIFISSVESLGIKSDNLCFHNRINGREFVIIH